MRSFPLFLKLEGRPVLLVGAGSAAAAKLRLLGSAGARVTVIAHSPSADLLAAVADTRAELVRDALSPQHFASAELVFGATGNEADDRAVAEHAHAAGKLVNIVDRPELSDFTMPAIVDRGDIVVAVSTHGASPVLAQRVRAAIESVLPPGLGRLSQFAQRFRTAIQSRIGENAARRRFWNQVLSGPIAAAVLAGDEKRADARPDPCRQSRRAEGRDRPRLAGGRRPRRSGAADPARGPCAARGGRHRL